MGADQIKIEIDVESREAIAALAKIAAATANVEKETKKLSLAQKAWAAANADIGQASKEWQEAGSRIASVGTAFLAAAAAGVAFAAHVEQQEAKLRRLGAAYNNVVAATNGAISASQALQLQGQIQAAGVQISGQQLGLLTRAVREYAQATGNDASEAVEKLTNAIVNNSEDALSELNLAQARATTSTQTLANVTRELENRYRGVAPAARTLSEDLSKIPDALTAIGGSAMRTALTALEELANRFSSTGRAGSEFFRGASRGWRDVVEAGDTTRAVEQQRATDTGNADRQLAREQLLARARTAGVQISQNDLRGLSAAQMRQLQSRFETGLGVTSGRGRGADLEAAFGSQAMVGSAQTLFDAQLNRIQMDQRFETRAAERRAGTIEGVRLTEMEAGIERKLRKTNLASASANNELRDAIRAYQEAVAEMPDGAVQVLPQDMPQNPRESATAYYTRLAEIQRGFNQAGAVNDLTPAATSDDAARAEGLKRIEQAEQERERGIAQRERQQRRFARDRGTRRMAREESLGGRVASSLGFRTDDEGRIEGFNGAVEGAALLTGAVNTLSSGLTTLFDTLVSGSADAGTAFQAFAANLLSELGKLAFQKGLFYTFEGIASLFTAPPAAPLYFAAGGGLIALGAALGAAGAAAKPQIPSAAAVPPSSNATRGLAPRSAPALGGGNGSPVNVYLGSLIPGSAQEAVRARDSFNAIGRRNPSSDLTRTPRRMEH